MVFWTGNVLLLFVCRNMMGEGDGEEEVERERGGEERERETGMD